MFFAAVSKITLVVVLPARMQADMQAATSSTSNGRADSLTKPNAERG